MTMSGLGRRRTIVTAACASILVGLALVVFVAPFEPSILRAADEQAEIGGVRPGDPDASEGDYIAQARVDTIIARLKGETIEESLAHADYVDDYFYPGYYPETAQYGPWDDVLVLLSNRRLAKLYGELKKLSGEEQYVLLTKYFNKFMSQHKEILEKYDVARGTPTVEDYDPLGRISESPGKGRTLTGTVYAVRMITLLSGMLGNCRMWPLLREAFRAPVNGEEVDETRYDENATRTMRRLPLFPVGVRANAVFCMADNSNDEDAQVVGFDRNSVLVLVPQEKVLQFRHPDFRSRVTVFDVHHRLGEYPEDWSHGYFDLRFVRADGRSQSQVFETVAAAAMGEAAQ